MVLQLYPGRLFEHFWISLKPRQLKCRPTILLPVHCAMFVSNKETYLQRNKTQKGRSKKNWFFLILHAFHLRNDYNADLAWLTLYYTTMDWQELMFTFNTRAAASSIPFVLDLSCVVNLSLLQIWFRGKVHLLFYSRWCWEKCGFTLIFMQSTNCKNLGPWNRWWLVNALFRS